MSSDPAPATQHPASRASALPTVVGSVASRLQRDYLGERGDRAQAKARGVLAELRRAAGTTPERDLLSWQATLELVLPDLPPALQGHGDAPSPSERAAFDSLTLFGLHMQSAVAPMHVQGRSFARAIGALVQKRSSSESIAPRFEAALVVRSAATRRHHLRSLITLLRTERIGFDYGRFALDLRRIAGDQRNSVLLQWGRDFTLGRIHGTATRSSEPADD